MSLRSSYQGGVPYVVAQSNSWISHLSSADHVIFTVLYRPLNRLGMFSSTSKRLEPRPPV